MLFMRKRTSKAWYYILEGYIIQQQEYIKDSINDLNIKIVSFNNEIKEIIS